MASTDYPSSQLVFGNVSVERSFVDNVSSQVFPILHESNYMCECEVTVTYKMYGYCTTHSTIESWESVGSPDPNPPPGFVSPHSIDPASIAYIIIKQEQL